MSIGLPNSSDTSDFDTSSFSQSLRYENACVPAAVMDDMMRLREFDREQEKRIRTWTIVGVVGIALFILGVVLVIAGSSVAGFAIAGIGLFTIIAGFVIRSKHARLNLDDRRYQVVSGLMRLLSKDMAAETPVTVSLDFHPHNHKTKLVRKGKVGYWNVKFHVDRWLEMRGRFVDGTKYTVTLIEKHQDRDRTKRSASGKIKHKSKTKTASEAIISLKFKEKRYPNAQATNYDQFKQVKLPQWVQLKSIKAEGDLLTIRATTSVPWDASSPDKGKAKYDGVHWLAMMFMNLYQQLNSAK